jgi:cytochrome c-type biogenesis protein
MSFSLSTLYFAGLLTFLSPCVLPLIPVYLAMLAGASAASLREGGNRGKLLLAATSLGVPTFVFVDQRGSEVARLVGEQPEDVLVQTLEVLAGQSCDGFHRISPALSPGS